MYMLIIIITRIKMKNFFYIFWDWNNKSLCTCTIKHFSYTEFCILHFLKIIITLQEHDNKYKLITVTNIPFTEE